jgi:hypothetical protein
LEAAVSRSRILTYDCAPTITWVKDANQVIVIEGRGARCWSLQGIEAIIWDLLSLNYGFARMVDLLAELSEGSRENAVTTLLTTMRHWEEEGIVTAGSRGWDG